jgi:FtsH-binding integral membrane protein
MSSTDNGGLLRSLVSPLRELAAAMGTLTGWGGVWRDGNAAPHRGPAVLAAQSLVMTGVAAGWCLAKIIYYGGEPAAGWLVVFVPLALPLALAAAMRPPRMALGLVVGGLVGATAGLLTVLAVRNYVAGFWLAFAGLSVAALAAATVFGYVTRWATTSSGRGGA